MESNGINLLDNLLKQQQKITVVEDFAQKHANMGNDLKQEHYETLIPSDKPGKDEQYSFKVDLDKCSGCKACVAGCHSMNGLDEDEAWREVGMLLGGEPAEPFQQHITSSCHHCVEPACAEGCPTNAYDKNPVTGIVKHLDDQCIGCQYCILKCPYDAPKYNKRLGIVRKCDMCTDRLEEGQAPACVQSCPTSAISIVNINKNIVEGRSEAGSMLPGTVESNYTKPTTTFSSKKELPKNALPADFYTHQPEHAHWPLIIFLTISQLGVGAFVIEHIIAQNFTVAMTPLRGYTLIACLVFSMIGVNAAALHLGRPLYAFRALVGLRSSWLSREILVFGMFATVSAPYVGLQWLPWLLDKATELSGTDIHLTALPIFGQEIQDIVYSETLMTMFGYGTFITGILGVVCSMMIYISCRREFWRETVTGIKFTTTTILLGLTTVFAVVCTTTALTGQELSNLAPITSVLCKCIFAVSLFKLTWEGSIFLKLKNPDEGLLHRSAILMTRDLKNQTILRFFAGVVGGIIIPLLMIFIPATNFQSYLILSLSIFTLTVIGELGERYLYFTAVVRNKMPGGV